jgi:hypothetical protein
MTLVHYFRSLVFVSFGAATLCLSQYVPPLQRHARRGLCPTHRLSLLPTRRAIIKHTPSFFTLLDRSKSLVVPVGTWTDAGERPRSTAFLFFFGRFSINLNYS